MRGQTQVEQMLSEVYEVKAEQRGPNTLWASFLVGLCLDIGLHSLAFAVAGGVFTFALVSALNGITTAIEGLSKNSNAKGSHIAHI